MLLIVPSGLLDFIPYLGTIMAGVLAVMLAYLPRQRSYFINVIFSSII
jgi:predicted PurR-regulated permease PerM